YLVVLSLVALVGISGFAAFGGAMETAIADTAPGATAPAIATGSQAAEGDDGQAPATSSQAAEGGLGPEPEPIAGNEPEALEGDPAVTGTNGSGSASPFGSELTIAEGPSAPSAEGSGSFLGDFFGTFPKMARMLPALIPVTHGTILRGDWDSLKEMGAMFNPIVWARDWGTCFTGNQHDSEYPVPRGEACAYTMMDLGWIPFAAAREIGNLRMARVAARSLEGGARFSDAGRVARSGFAGTRGLTFGLLDREIPHLRFLNRESRPIRSWAPIDVGFADGVALHGREGRNLLQRATHRLQTVGHDRLARLAAYDIDVLVDWSGEVRRGTDGIHGDTAGRTLRFDGYTLTHSGDDSYRDALRAEVDRMIAEIDGVRHRVVPGDVYDDFFRHHGVTTRMHWSGNADAGLDTVRVGTEGRAGRQRVFEFDGYAFEHGSESYRRHVREQLEAFASELEAEEAAKFTAP
ncbi:MAG: hypothetical protein KC416_09690, partial [Myxococcales bacterium]|nr:hypothetical protein [Myxococcales bacterium]